jgi:sugar transferase (PEP-CTERM/EpsH1 system associated)
MRILMLAHRIPYPPHTGDKTRAFHILRLLRARHEVTLGFLIDDVADRDGVTALREVVPDLEFRRIWKPWGLLRGLGSLATGGALSMSYFHSRGLRRRLARRSLEQPYDLVYAYSGPMAEYARGLGIPLVMDFVDVDSDKWRQYADHGRPPLSWLYRTEARRLQASEAEIASWASLCLLSTPVEEALLRSFAPWARTAVMPNGIDSEYYAQSGSGPSRPAVIFTGAMDYLPNTDAVRHFCADILPLVRREVPETAFYIVGLNPSSDVLRLGAIPGVTVTGSVPDVRPYYARAGVCVAPMRIGRGVQNKVLQGMAMSLPVVASSLAARGIQAEAGRDLEIADDPALFAAQVVRLLRSPTDRRRLGARGRACVEANYVWERNVDRLEPLLAAAAGRGAPRSENGRTDSRLARVGGGREPRSQP